MSVLPMKKGQRAALEGDGPEKNVCAANEEGPESISSCRTYISCQFLNDAILFSFRAWSLKFYSDSFILFSCK